MQMDLRSMSDNRTKNVYPEPRYALDLFDHGINRRVVSDPPREAVFFVGPFGNIVTGDVLALFFGNDLVPLVQIPLPPGPTGEVEIRAPAAELLRYVADNQVGRWDIWYAIVRPFEVLESIRLPAYLIDFQPPGGIPVFGDPSYVNTNLAPIPELETEIPQGQPLVMNVPPWENMTLGDKLTVRWGSTPLGPFEITTPGDIDLPVTVTVPWDVISGTDGGVASVDYYIIDEVNNHSFFAAAKVIDAGLPRLPPPILPDHMNGVIDLVQLGVRDVAVLVVYTGMTDRDQITLIVDRINDGGIPLPPYTRNIPGSASGSVRIDIPNALVRDIATGEIRVRYEVARVPKLTSGVTTAAVQGGGASLDAVETPEFPNYQIEVAQLNPAGLQVDIPRYAFLNNSDRITITSTFTLGGTTYTDTQLRLGSDFAGANVLSIRVPRDKIVPAAGGTGSIAYTVQPDGLPIVPAPARPLNILGAPPSEWDLEYDFDNDRTRFVHPYGGLFFPEAGTQVMAMRFDPAWVVPAAEELGVERYIYQETPDFRGNVVYMGHFIGATHNNRLLVDFAENWDVVRFAVTSVHQRTTITFKDAFLNVISPLIEIPAGLPERQIEVRYDDLGRRRIRHLEIRSTDVIRLDSFKFKR